MTNKIGIWIYLAFVAGNSFYQLLQAYNVVVQQQRMNGDWKAYTRRYWIPLLVRSAIETALFSLAWSNPDKVTVWLAKLWLAPPLAFFASKAIAFLAGFFADGLLGIASSLLATYDKLKWIKNYIPESPAGEAAQAKGASA